MEYADEYRLETIVPQKALTAVIQAMEKVHLRHNGFQTVFIGIFHAAQLS